MLMSPRIELTPECAYLTSESFCYIRHPLRVSTTRHLVLNLVEMNKVDPTKTKVITGQGFRADYPTFSTTLNDAALVASIPQEHSLAVGCPACRGQHKKHTCGKGKGGPPKRRRIQEYQSQKMYQKKKSRNKSYGMSLRKMNKWHRRSQNRQFQTRTTSIEKQGEWSTSTGI